MRDMLTTAGLRQRPVAFRSLTGLTGAQFDDRYQEVAAHDEAAEADRVLMALVWLRVYPTYAVLGVLWGFHKSTLCRRLQFLLPRLREVTSVDRQWPDARQGKRDRGGDLLRDFPAVEVVVDATEQRSRRPQSSPTQDTQRAYFSGKKKHALKTQITLAPDGRIQAVGASVPGATRDRTLLRQTGIVPRGQGGLMGDAGYQGLATDYPEQLWYPAHRASRGHPLTEKQREGKRRLSHYRIKIAQVLAQLKIYQVLAQVYRHGRDAYHSDFCIVAALANRRAGFSPLLAR